MYQRAVAAYKVYADVLGNLIHGFRNFHIAAACRADKADGSDGNALVYDGNAVFGGDVVTRFNKIFSAGINFIVNFCRGFLSA